MNKNIFFLLALVILAGLAFRAYRNGWRPFGGDKVEVVAEVSPTPVIKKGIDGRNLYPSEEVTNHASETNCWLNVNGKIYDITQYLKENPDNKELRTLCGKEAGAVEGITTLKKAFVYLGDVYVPGSK